MDSVGNHNFFELVEIVVLEPRTSLGVCQDPHRHNRTAGPHGGPMRPAKLNYSINYNLFETTVDHLEFTAWGFLAL